jgi:hypothetical protein
MRACSWRSYRVGDVRSCSPILAFQCPVAAERWEVRQHELQQRVAGFAEIAAD